MWKGTGKVAGSNPAHASNRRNTNQGRRKMRRARNVELISLVACVQLLGTLCVAEETKHKGDPGSLEFREGGAYISWMSQSGPEVQIAKPRLMVKNPENQENAAITLRLASRSTEESRVILNYQAALDNNDWNILGMCRVAVATQRNSESDLLLVSATLTFSRTVECDVIVQCPFQVPSRMATNMILPERDGYLRSYRLGPEDFGAGRFELGAQSTSGAPFCSELGMPVVGLTFDRGEGDSEEAQLAVSIDPYCGGYSKSRPSRKTPL